MNHWRIIFPEGKRNFKKVPLTLLIILFLPCVVSAATGHYKGHGISFDYPAKYTLSEERKKSSDSVKLKNGSDSIVVGIMDNVLIDGFDDIVIQTVTKQFKEKGYSISDVTKERKEIPLHVKGEEAPINVDAVKFNHVIEVTENEIHIRITQTLFFFSYGDHGYTVNYSRIKGKYSDLVTVLSSLTFDEKEREEDTAKASLY